MDNQLNQLNLQMRQAPWYQNYFRQRGLNPNQVQLNDMQRQELSALAAQNGVPMGKDNIIDKAGNVNTHHGFAGQPGWLKGLEIGGAGAAGAFFGGPAIASLLGHGAAPGLSSSLADISGVANAAGSAGTGGLSSSLGDIAGVAGASQKAVRSGNGGGSVIGKLLGGGGDDDGEGGAQGFADIGSMLGSYAESEAGNRMIRGNQTQNYDQLKLQADRNQRDSESDIMRKLAQTNYIQNGGAPQGPSSVMMGGQQKQLPDFGLNPLPSSDAQKTAAGDLQTQLLARMKTGAYQPQPLSNYTQRGAGEKAANIGSLLSSGWGAAKNIFGF